MEQTDEPPGDAEVERKRSALDAACSRIEELERKLTVDPADELKSMALRFDGFERRLVEAERRFRVSALRPEMEDKFKTLAASMSGTETPTWLRVWASCPLTLLPPQRCTT